MSIKKVIKKKSGVIKSTGKRVYYGPPIEKTLFECWACKGSGRIGKKVCTDCGGGGAIDTDSLE